MTDEPTPGQPAAPTPQWPAAPAPAPQDPTGQPGPTYAPPPVELPRPSRVLAFWALAISLVSCFGITAVLAIILAIVALVKVKSGQAAGKGIAITAIVISMLGLLLFAGVVAFSTWLFETSAHRGADGRIDEAGRLFTLDMRVGDCLQEVDLTKTVFTTTGVPCADPHVGEVVGVVDIDMTGPFPGTDVIDREASRMCAEAVDRYTGGAFGVEDTFYLGPIEESWEADKGVICIVELATPRTGSIAAR
jgi:hypothetical protein